MAGACRSAFGCEISLQSLCEVWERHYNTVCPREKKKKAGPISSSIEALSLSERTCTGCREGYFRSEVCCAERRSKTAFVGDSFREVKQHFQLQPCQRRRRRRGEKERKRDREENAASAGTSSAPCAAQKSLAVLSAEGFRVELCLNSGPMPTGDP